MKANAPEKIYMPTLLAANAVGFKIDGGIEYIRTDAFIEKACNAFCKACKMPNCRSNECKLIDDFRKYIEGE